MPMIGYDDLIGISGEALDKLYAKIFSRSHTKPVEDLYRRIFKAEYVRRGRDLPR